MFGDPKEFDEPEKGVVPEKQLLRPLRRRFLARVAAECDGLRDEAVNIQIGVIGRVYTGLQDAPAALSPREREAAVSLLEQGISADERARRARAFRHQLNESVQDRLGQQGYPILQETWNVLNTD
jgi:hypothetical protein